MRTPGTNINTVRYVSHLTGNSLHTTTSGDVQRGIRPVYHLSRNFFKNVKPDVMGDNVKASILSSYSANDLLSGGQYTKEEIIDLGYNEKDLIFSNIALTDSNGKRIDDISDNIELNLNLTYTGNLSSPLVIMALYTDDGKLIDIDCAKPAPHSAIHLSISQSFIPKYAYVKCLILDSGTLAPLCKPIIF